MSESPTLKQTPKEGKVEKVDLVDLDTKVTISTFSTKSTKQLIIKGLSVEAQGQFKLISCMLNKKYSELQELILASFIENNKIIQTKLNEQGIKFTPSPRELPEILEIRDSNLDLTIKRFREALLKGKFDNIPQKLAYLDERARDTHLPTSQRKEVIQLITDVKEVMGC